MHPTTLVACKASPTFVAMDPRIRPRIQSKPSALAFDLAAGCAALLGDVPNQRPELAIVQQWASGQGPSGAAPSQLLDTLSELIIIPHYTTLVAIHFRPLIVDLTARLLPSSEATWHDARTRDTFHAMCRLLPVMPEICP